MRGARLFWATVAIGLATSSGARSADRPTPPEATGLSSQAGQVKAWIVAKGDNRQLPFVIVDKVQATVRAFDPQGNPVGSAAALLGRAIGDDSPSGIGERRLADIAPRERITPAGRFFATLGDDLAGKRILWVDYEAAISLHPVITTNPAEHRLQRLASATPADNRISYGCINVPPDFFATVITPLFRGKGGIVYILPETRTIALTFKID